MINPGNSQKEKAMDEVAAPEQQDLAQEQQEQQSPQEQNADSTAEPVVTEENKDATDNAVVTENAPRRGKKHVKKVRQVTEAELMPRPSIWPLLLAFSIAVMLGGFAFNLIILGVGVIMVIASIIGWSLERR
jgi:hypothetical protein